MWEATVLVLRDLVGPVHVVTDGLASFQPSVDDIDVLPYLHLQLRRGALLPQGVIERLVTYPRRNDYAAARAIKLARMSRLPAKVARWRDTITSAKGLVISGAGAMTDDFAPHGVASWWLVARWARDAGVPVYLLGQGVGPLVDNTLRSLATDLVSWAEVVNVREEGSAWVIEGLQPDLQPVVTADWAILDVPDDADRVKARQCLEDCNADAPFIALSAHRRHNTTRAQFEASSRLFEDLTTAAVATGRAVLFVPNMTGVGYSDDRATFDLMAASWSAANRSAVHVVRSPLGPRVARALFGLAESVVTTRYHPLVFALAEGTPSIGVSFDAYYDQKLAGASAMFGVGENVLRLEEASAAEVHSMVGAMRVPTAPEASQNPEMLRRALGARATG